MTLPQHTQNSARFKRLRYQSWHRGCKETDVILGNYFDTHAADLTEDELTLYEELLDEDDWDIWKWVAYDIAPPKDKFLPLIERLRAFHEYASF